MYVTILNLKNVISIIIVGIRQINSFFNTYSDMVAKVGKSGEKVPILYKMYLRRKRAYMLMKYTELPTSNLSLFNIT
jgi:hypothetical protein